MVRKPPSFNRALKKIRQQKKLSAYKLCKLAGVDTSYYSKIENKNKLPSLKTAIKLTKILQSSNLIYFYMFQKYSETDYLWKKAMKISKKHRPEMPFITLSRWAISADNKKEKKIFKHLVIRTISQHGKKPEPELVSELTKKLKAVQKVYKDYLKFCAKTFNIKEKEVLDKMRET